MCVLRNATKTVYYTEHVFFPLGSHQHNQKRNASIIWNTVKNILHICLLDVQVSGKKRIVPILSPLLRCMVEKVGFNI